MVTSYAEVVTPFLLSVRQSFVNILLKKKSNRDHGKEQRSSAVNGRWRAGRTLAGARGTEPPVSWGWCDSSRYHTSREGQQRFLGKECSFKWNVNSQTLKKLSRSTSFIISMHVGDRKELLLPAWKSRFVSAYPFQEKGVSLNVISAVHHLVKKKPIRLFSSLWLLS